MKKLSSESASIVRTLVSGCRVPAKLLVLLLVLLASCSKESDIVIPPPPDDPPIVFAKEEVDVDFASSSAGEFTTRAVLNAADEFKIAGTSGGNDGDIRVLVFNHTDDQYDTLQYSKTVSNFQQDVNSYTYRFKVELTDAGDAIDMWILGNAGARWDAVAEGLVGHRRSEVKAALEYDESSGVTQVEDGEPALVKTLFPLWGVISDVVVQKSSGSATAGQVKASTAASTNDPAITSVGLYRMVAKIDVYLSGSTAKTNHAVEKVILYNRNTQGSLIPQHPYAAPSSSEGFEKPTIVSSPAVNDSLHSVTYDAVHDSVSNSIYAFEVDSIGGATYTTEPCLILGARYNRATSPITWYRVPFTDGDGKKLSLIRNKRYVVRVTALNSEGSSTPDEALKTVNVNNIVASVINWTDVDVPFPD